MWNPFSKKSSADDEKDPQKMGMLQRLAMKKLQSMSEKDRMKLMQKFVTPENIQKNRGKILEAMEAMKASGQINAQQLEEAKRKMGL
jgi:hypothetical protein